MPAHDDLVLSTRREHGGADRMRADMLGPRQHHVLTLEQIRQVGQALVGHPEGLELYGRPPGRWFADGLRIAGRTSIEAALDPLSARIAVSARTCFDAIPTHRSRTGVIDLFAGSANLMLHLAAALDASCVGIEQDPVVFELTQANLARLRHPAQLRLGSWEQYFEEPLAGLDTAFFVVAPPWGEAFSFRDGLDLRRTRPPVHEVLGRIAQHRSASHTFCIVQIPRHEPVLPESPRELRGAYQMVEHVAGCLIFALP